jgi:hypothetical protein
MMKYHKTMITTSIMLSLASLNAEASLTSGFAGGKNVVYDNVTNITWTGDANLLGTLEASFGYNSVVNAIIAASPVINDSANFYDTPSNSGHHNVTSSDFSSSQLGRSSWYGAQAFTRYLNSINYAGSNLWTLPSAGTNPQFGYNQTSTQFGELFYNELGGTGSHNIPNTSNFINEKAWAYWLGSEWASSTNSAWNFDTYYGGQTANLKNYPYYSWAISPSTISGFTPTAVPMPATVWLFGSALLGFVSLKRRGQA